MAGAAKEIQIIEYKILNSSHFQFSCFFSAIKYGLGDQELRLADESTDYGSYEQLDWSDVQGNLI